MSDELLDLLVVGAGPTGLSVGAEAKRAGIERLLIVDRGALTESLLEFPTYMTFFTTRDRLEIGDLPLTIAVDKPDRRQALAYYRAVADHFQLPLATYEEVLEAQRVGDSFSVSTRNADGVRQRRSRCIVLATGFFGQPKKLGVPGEDLSWVHRRYREPYRHFGERVILIGGGNSVAEAALELLRAGVEVTVVVRAAAFKPTVKYWIKPDIENRIAEGSIAAHFNTVVRGFSDRGVEIQGEGRKRTLPAAAAYVLIGYTPEVELFDRCGVEFHRETLVPSFDPETCESNVAGLFLGGAILAGRNTGKIFIDNSRDHSLQIVQKVAETLKQSGKVGERVP